LIGTPAEIAADIERFAALGIDEIDIEFVDFPDTRGMELFADEVLPAVG
jgi:alkanesulfonate monooxygenase SsuD/methylene tetrahydromethanopterin reductase-like flavin-dependent oxidoreductase (luciferase family)